jgi:hypothetical protein
MRASCAQVLGRPAAAARMARLLLTVYGVAVAPLALLFSLYMALTGL